MKLELLWNTLLAGHENSVNQCWWIFFVHSRVCAVLVHALTSSGYMYVLGSPIFIAFTQNIRVDSCNFLSYQIWFISSNQKSDLDTVYRYIDSTCIIYTLSQNDELGSFKVGPIYRHAGWHQLQFAYHANGDNLGSLTAGVMPVESARKKRQTDSGERVLWASDLTASSDWRTVAETFYQEGRWFKYSYISCPCCVGYLLLYCPGLNARA